jgi:hypothetical protein
MACIIIVLFVSPLSETPLMKGTSGNTISAVTPLVFEKKLVAPLAGSQAQLIQILKKKYLREFGNGSELL